MPPGVRLVDGAQRLGSIGHQDRDAGQLGVPVAGQGQRLEAHERQHVLDPPLGPGRAQDHQLVRPGRRPTAGVHAGDVGLEDLEDVGVEHRSLSLGDAAEAERSRQAVHPDGARSEHLCQRPAARPGQDLELEPAVLAMAEAEAEPGVRGRSSLDVRDAPAISADRDGRVESLDAERASRPRQTAAEQSEQGSCAGPAGHPAHDATVYSAA
jgi:hypothetical protein